MEDWNALEGPEEAPPDYDSPEQNPLKDCAHCGSSIDNVSNKPWPADREGTSWVAACGNVGGCGAEINLTSRDRTIEAWNRRVLSDREVQLEAILAKLKLYFTSGNNVPVERATIYAKDFHKIIGE